MLNTKSTVADEDNCHSQRAYGLSSAQCSQIVAAHQCHPCLISLCTSTPATMGLFCRQELTVCYVAYASRHLLVLKELRRIPRSSSCQRWLPTTDRSVCCTPPHTHTHAHRHLLVASHVPITTPPPVPGASLHAFTSQACCCNVCVSLRPPCTASCACAGLTRVESHTATSAEASTASTLPVADWLYVQ